MPVRHRIKKMELSVALDKYYVCASMQKRGRLQEFYRMNVIKRSALSRRYMHEISSVDIAEYRDNRMSEVNIKTGKPNSSATVRLELALLSSLFNLARIEWGTCTHNPVEHVRKPPASKGRTRHRRRIEFD